MAKKWTNEDLPGALHFVTGNVNLRRQIFKQEFNCRAFLEVLQHLRATHPYKLICFVIMLDHFHLIVNPEGGTIRAWTSALKSLSAKKIIELSSEGMFQTNSGTNQVWQESFKDFPLWSHYMIWQKINYIHNNPLKARLVKSTLDYKWSSFRSFYGHDEQDPMLPVDRDWFWEGDMQKLKVALVEKGWSQTGASNPS
jgi:putative transposase